MSRWVKKTKRVPISWVKPWHSVKDENPTYSAGQNIAVIERCFTYLVYDGHHRLRDAVRRGDRYITVDIWRKR